MKKPAIALFKRNVWSYYRAHGRHDLPWRKTSDPYRILVSEVMLQQTQVDRVVPKYRAFLKAFPTARALARASVADVLKLWSGLGYNRRALFLKRAAEAVVEDYGGAFPAEPETLRRLPGIGPYTAAAVATFSHNAPYTFIETNIRSVFLHEFFPKARTPVTDEKLMPYIEAALDRKNPREWYWALMDYGSHLKKTMPNPSRTSAHHAPQSRFKGSVREVRGAMLRQLTAKPNISKKALFAAYQKPEDVARADQAYAGLKKDGLISETKGRVTIAS